MFGTSQSMGYDRSSIMYSPEGRIIQTEYAREAMKRGSISVVVQTKNGVVLAGYLRPSELDLPNYKISVVDTHILSIFSGYAADGRVLINRARVDAQIHRLTYGTPIGVVQLATKIGDYFQAYTQSGGVRPFGVGLLFGGIEPSTKKPAAVFVNPGGGVIATKAKAIGEGENQAIKYLKEHYKDDMTLEQLKELAKATIREVVKDPELPDEQIEMKALSPDNIEWEIF